MGVNTYLLCGLLALLLIAYSQYHYSLSVIWSDSHFTDIRDDFKLKIFGQHIATDYVQRYLKAHLSNPYPKKALVLSFHGTTGSGKSYLTHVALGRLVYNGIADVHVTHWNAVEHFKSITRIEEYKETIRTKVLLEILNYERSIFIFQHADHLPAGLLDVLVPMTEKNARINGIDCTRATFIFTSRTGAREINEEFTRAKNLGYTRNEVGIKTFSKLIRSKAYNETEGFHKLELIEKDLIDLYVPFLPLERTHVQKCIMYFFKSNRCAYKQKTIEDTAKAVRYNKEGYAIKGCKNVRDRIPEDIKKNCIRKALERELRNYQDYPWVQPSTVSDVRIFYKIFICVLILLFEMYR